MKLEIVENLPVVDSHLAPLLFIHGSYHGAWCWNEHFLPYFSSKGFPCYALSLRGHGESEGIEKLQSFSLHDYTDDVLDVIKQIKNKPVVIGHSLGGAIAQKILYTQSETIKAVVLMAAIPPNGMGKDTLRLLVTHFRDMRQLRPFNQGKSTAFPTDLFFAQNLTTEEKKALTRRLQPESDKASYDLYRRIVPRSTIDAGVPILVLGSKKDVLFPEKTVKSIGKAYQTQPVIFPDISHVMMLDPNWKTVANQILAFLHTTVAER